MDETSYKIIGYNEFKKLVLLLKKTLDAKYQR